MLPTVEVLDETTLRVYFAALDESRRGRIGFVDLDARSPSRILRESMEPVLDTGAPGLFDDSGVNPSCLLRWNGRKLLYYIGWQRTERVPYLLFLGLAVDDGSGRFERARPVPVLDRTPEQPFLRSASSVLPVPGGLRAWHVSAHAWERIEGRLYPVYAIRRAASEDGIHWVALGGSCFDLRGDEFGFGRPWVIDDGGLYRMWYSIRSRSAPYRIGYAESRDGEVWERMDSQVGIAASPSGWDSEMICYPCIVDAAGHRYLFYNGNGHGETGFGYAVLDD